MFENEAKLLDDPWCLTEGERHAALARHAAGQQRWLPRLRRLVEPPAPGDDFPAFLLALPQHARLERAVATAACAEELDVGTADELQRFVDHYRSWLGGRPEDADAGAEAVEAAAFADAACALLANATSSPWMSGA